MDFHLQRQTYGKHCVHISRVLRSEATPSVHQLVEISVNVQLEGAFAEAYTKGDNALVVATDTCKNIVHNVALDHPMDSIESFGLSLTDFFLKQYDHVDQVTVSLVETVWDRINEHPHGFSAVQRSQPTTAVQHQRDQEAEIRSGLRDLVIAKTTESGFSNFHRDQYRTLPDTGDRILATSMQAEWLYCGLPASFGDVRVAIQSSLIETFLDHYSVSVQETLMRMAESALKSCIAIERIRLVMPNKHHVPVDMSAFGKENHNDLFVVTPEPYGYIEAEVSR